MDRRAFITSLIGGMAAASLGGFAAAHAATPLPVAEPETGAGQKLAPETSEALGATNADYAQYYRRRRYYRRYRRPGRRYYDRRTRSGSQR